MVVDGAGRDDPARLRTRHRAAMPLPRHRRAVRIGVDCLAQSRAIDDDARGIVLGEDAEVQRRELRFADAAEARRERNAVRPGRSPVQEVDAAHCAQLRTRAPEQRGASVLRWVVDDFPQQVIGGRGRAPGLA